MTNDELSSFYKRVLMMLKEIEMENSAPNAALKKHMRTITAEMKQEDVAVVEKLLQDSK